MTRSERRAVSICFAICAFASTLVESAAAIAANESAPLVGFLIENGVYDSELVAPLDVLHHTPSHAPPGFAVCTIASTKQPIRSYEGLQITPDYDYATAPELAVLVVPSAQRHVDPSFDDPALFEFVKKRAATARFVMSLCDGAFVLAKSGLLDGVTCTTFPGDIAKLRERFQKAVVVDNVSFVVDGKFITSVGGARSYDPALYLVERTFGSDAAHAVAKGLVIDWDLGSVPHLVHDVRGPTARRSYLFGEKIESDVFVENADGSRRPLLDLRPIDAKVIVLVIFGGGATTDSPPRAGLWCEDSLSEMGTLRHAIARFSGPDAIAKDRVCFVPVACPPLHHETRFGYELGAFRHGGAKSSRADFARQTQKLVTNGLLPFSEIYFDFEYRLLRNLAVDPVIESAAEHGIEEPTWIGRFRAEGDAQEYGTPTIWILSRDGKVLAPPFHDNNWESGKPLRHTSRELEAAIARALEIA